MKKHEAAGKRTYTQGSVERARAGTSFALRDGFRVQFPAMFEEQAGVRLQRDVNGRECERIVTFYVATFGSC